jgi:hypothetical protein
MVSVQNGYVYFYEVFKVVDKQSIRLYGLEGAQYDWETFYEPFAGDNYYKGPATDKPLPPGLYRIKVSNPHNEGKYVLCVGRKETFTMSEAMQMIQRLPDIKRFFEKSPLTAFFNLVGLFMLLFILLLAGTAFLVYRKISGHFKN